MPWFPVDDGFHSHPKRLAISLAAVGLWTVAGSWSSAHPNDGVVPDAYLESLSPDAPMLAAELVAAGLWRRRRGGYQFHDWFDWGCKRSAEEDRLLRAKRAEAGRKGGTASGRTRSKREAKPSGARSKTEANGIRDAPPGCTETAGKGGLTSGNSRSKREAKPKQVASQLLEPQPIPVRGASHQREPPFLRAERCKRLSSCWITNHCSDGNCR